MNYEYAAARAKEIVSRMTPYEKLSQLCYESPEIERLGINACNWWNEAAHGVARDGVATVFPQAIAMGATFDPPLVRRVAEAVSLEARAKYNKNAQFGDYDIYKGLTFWTPNINIFRDPRWGRGQETFGEDPYLTSRMGVSYIKGLQGEGNFAVSAACAKHFAGHSGPEKLRHTFDAQISLKDLWETYLPAFEHAVKSGVLGVMGAYNRTNGYPCCAHPYLMGDVLRGRWGFKGYFVSDCGAVADIYSGHHFAFSLKDAAVSALNAGCDLNCGEAYLSLVDAYEEDLIDEERITEAVELLYTVRALLGEFEEKRPFSDVSYDVLDCDEHRELNLRAARESMVLLKNENGFLPISDGRYNKIAVIGPTVNSIKVLEGNYNGMASEYVTFADGMRRVFRESRITVAGGSLLYAGQSNKWAGFSGMHSEGLAAASEADATVVCLGLDRTVEGEEIDIRDPNFDGGDRTDVTLPDVQIRLAEEICDLCENVVVVVACGSAVDLGEKIRSKAKAIVHAWYPGAQGGLALAQLIAGEYSPSGRLPVTFYRAENALPDITDYSMKGRTYRFIESEPLYPFGYGLSYTSFRYDSFELVSADGDAVRVRVRLTNTGKTDGVEKAQFYAKYTDSRTSTPNFQLCGVESVFLRAGESAVCEATLDRFWIKAVTAEGERVDPDGEIKLYAGGHQPDAVSERLCGTSCLELTL